MKEFSVYIYIYIYIYIYTLVYLRCFIAILNVCPYFGENFPMGFKPHRNMFKVPKNLTHKIYWIRFTNYEYMSQPRIFQNFLFMGKFSYRVLTPKFTTKVQKDHDNHGSSKLEIFKILKMSPSPHLWGNFPMGFQPSNGTIRAHKNPTYRF